MAVTIIPTELSADGEAVERHDRAHTFPSRELAEEALKTTVASLMERAGMSYHPDKSLNENVDRYYSTTGHAFGWIMETTEPEIPMAQVPHRGAKGMAIWRLIYLIGINIILIVISPAIEDAIVLFRLTTPTGAALVTTVIRAFAIVALIAVFVLTIRRFRHLK